MIMTVGSRLPVVETRFLLDVENMSALLPKLPLAASSLSPLQSVDHQRPGQRCLQRSVNVDDCRLASKRCDNPLEDPQWQRGSEDPADDDSTPDREHGPLKLVVHP